MGFGRPPRILAPEIAHSQASLRGETPARNKPRPEILQLDKQGRRLQGESSLEITAALRVGAIYYSRLFRAWGGGGGCHVSFAWARSALDCFLYSRPWPSLAKQEKKCPADYVIKPAPWSWLIDSQTLAPTWIPLSPIKRPGRCRRRALMKNGDA